MFGYYDPASLKLEGRKASINFIDAVDGRVTPIVMGSRDEMVDVAASIGDQERYGIASRDGSVKEIRGVFVAIPGHPDEGLIAPEHNQKKTIPLKMTFDVAEGDIPKDGFAIMHGISHRGAFMVHRIAMKSADPEFDKRRSAEFGPH